jgi:hypothetical protein
VRPDRRSTTPFFSMTCATHIVITHVFSICCAIYGGRGYPLPQPLEPPTGPPATASAQAGHQPRLTSRGSLATRHSSLATVECPLAHDHR